MEQVQTTSPRDAVAELEARLRATPRAARPLEHAALRYHLGLAYAELPDGDRQVNLSRAVASYRQALALFGEQRFPVEHARVSYALAAALRDLGDLGAAVEASQRAVALLSRESGTGQVSADLGAALNNLGLIRSDLGQHEEAIAALRSAADVFGAIDEPRQRLMALHNLGQAQAAAGDHAAAVETYEGALADADSEEAPYQWGLLQHAAGVSLTALNESARAIAAFERSLRAFTRARHPFQHALAKNNLGLACAQLGDVSALRRAVASYEDALGVLDVRLHRPQWEQVYRNLEMAEAALRDAGVADSRPENFAALVGGAPRDEAVAVLRERLMHLLEQPDPRRSHALGELSLAMLRLPPDAAARATNAWLAILMELPNDYLIAGLQGRLAAHAELETEEQRLEAAEILERAIADELLAPQRIRVRDTLEMMGYERP